MNGGAARSITAPAEDSIAVDGWFTVTANISAVGTSAITSIRVDPIGGAGAATESQTTGNTFDVDFIRLNSVPEPSTAILGALGSLMLLRRRR